MDFVTGLPRVKNIDTILVVVDWLTKYAHFCPIGHPVAAKQAAKVFIREFVRLHGIPRTIISDCDFVFMSLFWRELFTQYGTSCIIAPSITRNPMVKPRLSIAAWRHIYVALPMTK